jgi:hypothetical protein
MVCESESMSLWSFHVRVSLMLVRGDPAEGRRLTDGAELSTWISASVLQRSDWGYTEDMTCYRLASDRMRGSLVDAVRVRLAFW